MTMNKRIRFADVLRLKKSDPIPVECNEIVREVAKVSGDSGLLSCLEAIEKGKWYGPLLGDGVTFEFRYGVCQSFKKDIALFGKKFVMNVINESIDFSKEKK